MRASALVVGLLASCVVLAGTPPVEHVSDEGKFKVAFPAKPTVRTVKNRGNLATHAATVETAASMLTVIYYDIPIDVPMNDEFVKKGLLNEASGIFLANKGELKSHQYTKQQKAYDAIEYAGTVTKPYDAHVQARSIIVGKRVYTVMALGSADFIKSAAAQKLLDSFQITK